MLICTLVSGGMDGCMYDMYIGIWWHGQLYVLICTLVSGGKDGCMYVNMYIGIWLYGRLYVC
jgi:diphthamide synthase (EF-2-diphthine--ammonia ligase)